MIWTRPQRRVVAGILVLLLAWSAYRLATRRMIVPTEQLGPGPRAADLDDRLDPNTASAAELATLPGIGGQTARDIVAYREQFKSDGRGDAPFSSETDLLKVKGIGAGAVHDLSAHLRFPTTRPYHPSPRATQ